jgi:predicted lactoylglutathione lyase
MYSVESSSRDYASHPSILVFLMSVTKLAMTRLFFVVFGNAEEELFRHNQQQCIKQSTSILINLLISSSTFYSSSLTVQLV